MDSQSNSGARVVLLVLFCFLLFRIPIAAEYYNYHSDEAYFTDNALEMMLRNDYITSFHGGDETPRFDKPPPTAWCVVLGFKLFGVSILSSRIVFLWVGAAIVWLTYRFARKLLEDEKQAALAAVILVTNVTYLYHVGFALTDGLLTLGVLMTHIGIAEILLFGRRSAFALACTYLGLTLALSIKGIVALPPIAFACVFGVWLFRYSERRRERWLPLVLINIPCFVLAFVPLLTWMWLEYQRFGMAAITGELVRASGGFLQDQFLRRTERSQWITNIFFYPSNMFQVFLPWTLPLFLLFTKHRAAFVEEMKKKKVLYVFLLGSCLFEYFFYSPVNTNRSRYMMPVYPCFSIFLASWISMAVRIVRIDRFWKKFSIGLAAAAAVGGIALLVFAPQIPGVPLSLRSAATQLQGGRAVTAGILFLAGAAILLYWALVRAQSLLPALGIFILFAWSVFDFVEEPIFAQAPAADVAKLLNEHDLTGERLLLGREVMYELAPQLRVMTQGKLTYRFYFEHPDPNAKVILMKEGAIPDLPFANYKTFPAGTAYFRSEEPIETPFGRLKIGRAFDEEMFIYYVLKGDYKTFVSKFRKKYLLAIRSDCVKDTTGKTQPVENPQPTNGSNH